MPGILPKTSARPGPGRVVLLGAGPGSADLLTVRGARLLGLADVVLHDALVGPDVLALCAQARLVAVGKRAGQASMPQDEINAKLVLAAQEHALVIRLKGGDPMLFGRADEEMQALEAAGIPYEVVPGVTTAFAAAAASRQPLTKRGVARSVAFFTSTNGDGQPEQTSLPSCDTLVQYMGGREAIQTAERLLAAGKSPEMPVLAVENCSLPQQRILRLSLAELAQGRLEQLRQGHSGPVLVMAGWAMQVRPSQS
ncbi:uroporphyrinogen-III C-methyltransferase [Massilia sp. W12]|uniref:uroporphyrinogen-III C-methyltransferase n=1 Tax=Massilia sp. W12 TaxID=3126507 RepID=UPI0030D32F64